MHIDPSQQSHTFANRY